MTEEENKAIEFLETTRRSIIVTLGHEGTGDEWAKEELKHLNAILNLIKKQAKEIEKYKNKSRQKTQEILDLIKEHEETLKEYGIEE